MTATTQDSTEEPLRFDTSGSADAVLEALLLTRPDACRVLSADPRARRAALAIASYFLDVVPAVSGGPLSGRCLDSAASAVPRGTPFCFSRFLRGLLHPVPECARWHVYVWSGLRRRFSWDFVDSPLAAWPYVKHRRLCVVQRQLLVGHAIDPRAVRSVVATRAFSSADLETVDREFWSILGV